MGTRAPRTAGIAVVSGIGVWLAGSSQVVIGLVALPWVYGLMFVGLMLVSFKQ